MEQMAPRIPVTSNDKDDELDLSTLPATVEEVHPASKKKRFIFLSVLGILIVLPIIFFIITPKNIIQHSAEQVLAPFNLSYSTGAQGNYIFQKKNSSVTPEVATFANNEKGLTDAQVLALADDKYANGKLPLGDGKYVTTAPKKGYIYLCSLHSEGGGAQVQGSWIEGQYWYPTQKIHVQGSVNWPNATFSNTISGSERILAGNALPLTHTTGTFPIASSDPAYAYDRNPNSISAQNFLEKVAASPVYSDTPYCMGGEVGVMLSGVPIFNGFDAELRDAAANEVQDACDGHPQVSGEYHYHSLSACFKDTSVKTVLGYALDGFPITGPTVAQHKYLTTEDLDVCHGIISDIIIAGKTVTTYHYVMTQDFPYSASCFRGVASAPSGISSGQTPQTPQTPQSSPPSNTEQLPIQDQTQTQTETQTSEQVTSQEVIQQPPQEAITACSGKTTYSNCHFLSAHGDTISGTCATPHGKALACIPSQ